MRALSPRVAVLVFVEGARWHLSGLWADALRADVAVVFAARFAVGAFVAAERFTQLAEQVKQRQQQPPARRQRILDARRTAAVIASLDEFIVLHLAQTLDERATADRMQGGEQFVRAARAARQIAHDKQRPLVAQHLQDAGHRTTIASTSSHSSRLSSLRVARGCAKLSRAARQSWAHSLT